MQTMDTTQTALETLSKIQLILEEAGFKRSVAPRATLASARNETKMSPERVLVRVQGIIKGFTETNAELKLKNLVAFISALRK